MAMAGGSRAHNAISLNFASELRNHLRGKPCEVFMADVKARVLAHQQDTFYYPDVMVGCDERDTNDLYLRFPKLIIEVLSRSTERVDRNEKFLRYITIPTLEEYVLAEQSRQAVIIFRRRKGWAKEEITDPEGIVHLESVGLTLPLAAFYANVTLRMETERSLE
jgi:Uma2 family endonuclease